MHDITNSAPVTKRLLGSLGRELAEKHRCLPRYLLHRQIGKRRWWGSLRPCCPTHFSERSSRLVARSEEGGSESQCG
ncbi:hypothetical protein FIBSPDRAFT_874540 [Athelia psychrophila]|uniref:Uncharacterized protein n=1 Tax=Athelia psychrophila TaxID=1759441 RepID=A0A165XCN5_9AGAM|nr:hypothetical protein FIBSPDRAFT_874540 [Fibularhizoctonia sp. CBS 109695]